MDVFAFSIRRPSCPRDALNLAANLRRELFTSRDMFATVCHPLCRSGLSTSCFVRRHPVDIPIDPYFPPFFCFRVLFFPFFFLAPFSGEIKMISSTQN